VPRHQATAPGLTHLRVSLSRDFYIGPGRADLLELISETGSISEAARRLSMSYKRAWSLVQALNQSFGAALIETHRGGSDQGAALTPAGAEVLARYRHMQEQTRAAIAGEVSALGTLMARSAKAK
jgi:molybdate transport system regulatory protein